MDFDCDCDGFGFGWFFPALLVGKLIADAFDRPEPRGWPYPPPPQPVRRPQPEPQAREAALEPKAAKRVRCQICYHSVNAGFAFCPHCGARIAPPTCRYCGQQLDREMAYCPHCGGPAKRRESS